MYAISNSARDIPRLLESLNTIHWKWIVREVNYSGMYLRDFLLERLTHIPESSWDERSEWGGIYLNGMPAELNTALTLPCWIEYYEPKFGLENAKNELEPLVPAKHLVYEDEWIGVVYKPNRLHSNPAREQSHYSVRSALDVHYGQPVHLPSRLDFSTAGLLTYSHHPSAHAKLQSLFEQRKITKQYLALVGKIPQWQDCIFQGLIAKDARHPILRDMSHSTGKQSLTTFSRVAVVNEANPLDTDPQLKDHALILATPKTGRTHQIRLHLSSLGHPIVGDNFYGGDHHPQLHLLSYHLDFEHPITGRRVTLSAPGALLPEWARIFNRP